MDAFVKKSLLYDFYGDLLTEHQKEIYESYALYNLSLSEIAKESGISRQGVHDILKRCDLALEGYEDKLHLIKRFMEIKEMIKKIDDCTNLSEAKSIATGIIDKL